MKSALALKAFPYFLLTVSWMCWAQAEPQKPKLGPEYQRLHYFVGDWQIEWETLPGPMTGPGGKVHRHRPQRNARRFFCRFPPRRTASRGKRDWYLGI